MHRDVEALLALQVDDRAIEALEQRRAALDARLVDLDRARQVLADAIARAQGAVDAEERRRRELETRFAAHKQQHERNLAQFDAIRRVRDVTAAMSQIEQAARLLAEEESQLAASTRRVRELDETVEQQQQALAELEREQEVARAEIADQRRALEAELVEARGRRDGAAERIGRTLLGKYDRIRGRRRDDAVFALRGASCGNCDTAVPVQRRNLMLTTGTVEVCEACGVLLYAAASE